MSERELLDRRDTSRAEPEPADTLRSWFVASGEFPVRSGNVVRPLVDGEAAFRRICEAVDQAQFSVWTTVAFLRDGFEFPDGSGSFFEVFDRAAERGVDVRVVFWRPGEEMGEWRKITFWGSDEHHALLDARGSRIRARWDRSPAHACQHQKSWLIDAGHDRAVAFVGGINLNPHSVVPSGHRNPRAGENHDVYVEVSGPATMDVHHNFVERWNSASERTADDGLWGDEAGADLPRVVPEPRRRGSSLVQIQRTMPTGSTTEDAPDQRSRATSIFEQYRRAITAADESIYIENQALDVPVVLRWLRHALERGVEVVAVVPIVPDALGSDRQLSLKAFLALDRFENFTLAGLASSSQGGKQQDVYVHSKLMLVDDKWGTIGSCNLHAWSLFSNAEMNASFLDPAVVRQLRCDLFEEHLDETTAHLDAASAHRRFAQIARENRRRCDVGVAWSGLVLQLDPVAYAQQRFGRLGD